MTAAHHNFASPSIRAQDLLNGHIARIDAALRFLRTREGRLSQWTRERLSMNLHTLRSALDRDLHDVLACPSIAKHYNGKWGHNGFAPNVASACEAVDRARDADEVRAAYRRSIMRVVR